MTSKVRPIAAVMLGASATVLAGCGAHGRPQQSAGSQGALPRALAQQLAAESDAVAHELAAGQPCTALSSAMRLRRQTIEAIDAGRVPAAFRPTLRSTTADLASRIHCIVQPQTEPRARPAPSPEKNGHGNNGKHKGRSKNKGEGD